MTQSARKAELLTRLDQTRERTLSLFARVPDRFYNVRVHDFYSPVGWHFGHIGMTEEHWAVCRASSRRPLDSRLSFLFANLPENPKDNRVHLPG
ncbi:MAG TPA: DinB family protein, partial [Chthonomonadales bacterium]|nr:DinB family protein [Chthonomonadales bacterium]